MSNREDIAKRLNSVGLDVNDEFRAVLMDYFCDGDSDNNESESDDDLRPVIESETPQATTEDTVSERSIFSIGCFDDTGTLEEIDCEEQLTVDNFVAAQCCTMNCAQSFSKDTIVQSRINSRELNYYSKTEHWNFLHVSLLGSMDCCMASGPQTAKSRKKNVPRQKIRGHFYFRGQPVCRSFFLFVHDVSQKVYRSLCSVLATDGIIPRQHGNVAKTPLVRCLSLSSREKALKFIENFAVQNAVVLPGRVPGFKNPDLLLLPSEFTKKAIHEKYAAIVSDAERLPYSSFTELWRELLPTVCIQKPRTDLCSECKLDSLALSKLKSMDEEKRRVLLNRSIAHLNLVDQERQYYKQAIQLSKTEISNKLQPGHSFGISQSFDGTMHYSFDFFQQIHVPYDPEQVGALYFLTPYKVGLFGIMCETLAKMVMFIIPEGSVTGKGSNQVISMLHYYFEHYGIGETDVILNADNCVGQNKNQFVMSYLCWRVLTGMHRKVTLHFLVVGHTKFSPDYGAGVFKKLFRRTPCATPEDVAKCARKSSILEPVITGSIDGKETFVAMYDWQSKFSNFKAVPNLKRYQLFEFSCDRPGVVVCQEHSKAPSVSFTIIGSDYSDSSLPPLLQALGLSEKRQSYLYDKIRQFVPECSQDIVCPRPLQFSTNPDEPGISGSGQHTGVQETASCSAAPSVTCQLNKAAKAAKKTAAATAGSSKARETERLATPKRKQPTCSGCGAAGHRNLPSQCPLRKGGAVPSRRKI